MCWGGLRVVSRVVSQGQLPLWVETDKGALCMNSLTLPWAVC